MKLVLPYPPSCNRQYKQVLRRSKSGKPYIGKALTDEVKNFETAVRIAYLEQIKPSERKQLTGNLKVVMNVWEPKLKRKRDNNNLTKRAFDALTKAGVWGDDSQIAWYCVGWIAEKYKFGKCEIEITEII